MESIVNDNNKTWTEELAIIHKHEMIRILDNNGIK